MVGTDRVRDCNQCSRQVFKISDMTRSEAERFLRENGTSQCLLIYRRGDGTIMTDDCPVDLRKVRDFARTVKSAVAVFLGALFSASSVFAQGAVTNYTQGSKCSQNTSELPAEKIPTKRLWSKSSNVALRQLGVPDIVGFTPPTFDAPSYSELRSGQFALGKELVERNGRMYVLVDSNVSTTEQVRSGKVKHATGKNEQLEPVPSKIQLWQSEITPKILEAQKHFVAAEAFHKIFLKVADNKNNGAYGNRQQVASDYRDFLIRQHRVDDARKIESQFELEPEDISEVSEAFKPQSKTINIRVFGER